jgi:hypothetical protein
MGMRKMMWLLCCLILMVNGGVGQTVLLPAHSAWQYAAGVSGWNDDDVFGALRHPAMPVGIRERSMGLQGESMSGIPGASMLSCMVGFQAGSGVVGGVLDHRSFAGTGESRVVLGYALPLSSRLRAGVRLGVQGFRIPAHPLLIGIPVEWGLVYRHQKLSFGVAASQPVNLSQRELHPGIPAIFRFTTTFELSAGTGLALDVAREEGWGLSCRPMVFYQPSPSFRLTGGLVADKGSIFLRGRYKRASMGFHMFFDRDPYMGWTGAFGVDYQKNREEGR